jgi:hypothetical protein
MLLSAAMASAAAATAIAFFSLALHFQMEHDTRRNVGKILNLATVVGLALKGKVHWQACIHEGTPFAILLDNCLVGLEMAAGDK